MMTIAHCIHPVRAAAAKTFRPQALLRLFQRFRRKP